MRPEPKVLALAARHPACTIEPTATAREAAQLMAEQHVGSLVVAEGGVPLGMVTDRDVALHVLGDGLAPEATTVADCMSSPAVTIGAEASLYEAGRLLRRFGIRRLPVVDGGGKLLGVVTADDLLLLLGDQMHDAATAIRRGLANEASPQQPGSVLGKE